MTVSQNIQPVTAKDALGANWLSTQGREPDEGNLKCLDETFATVARHGKELFPLFQIPAAKGIFTYDQLFLSQELGAKSGFSAR